MSNEHNPQNNPNNNNNGNGFNNYLVGAGAIVAITGLLIFGSKKISFDGNYN
jgi:hypothetical protein